MFAVPGWSVSSNGLKPQIPETLKSTTTPVLPAGHLGTDVAAKASKKRKRSDGSSISPRVNAANFPDLWESVIEKRNTVGDSSREAKYTKKKPKDAQKHNERNIAVSSDEHNRKRHVIIQAKHRGSKDDYLASKATVEPSADRSTDGMKQIRPLPTTGPAPNLTPLQLSMKQKLVSARFRHLNQTLYTTPSAHSLALFQENPDMFLEYHEGFRRQVGIWPESPLEGYIAEIRRRGKERNVARTKTRSTENAEGLQSLEPLRLPRTDGVCHIADLGCGDAGLSRGLEGVKKKFKIQVFSYDLQSTSPLVIQADIAELPLRDCSIDIAIFCLALMGTNWIDFIEEAFRILRWKGELWIAEIKSRFGRVRGQIKRVDHSIGKRKKLDDLKVGKLETDVEEANLLVEVDGHEDYKGETDVSSFIEVLRKRGFILQHDGGVDLRNKMFVRMKFVKAQTPITGKGVRPPGKGVETRKKTPTGKFLDEDVPLSSEATVLKPCVYKVR